MSDRAVLTIATGKEIYWKMAVNLARSFVHWNRGNDIDFLILSDIDNEVPSDLRGRVKKLAVPEGALGRGFSSKLSLDLYAPAAQTLFVDADCLCVCPLDFVFERFAGRPVSVVGGKVSDGEWSGDVLETCRLMKVPALPKFNGGLYYIEPGTRASAIYRRARDLLPQYDEIGLVRLRNQPNEEPLMAIAMAQEDCWGIEEDGSILGDFQATSKIIALDCLLSRCELENPDEPDPRHKAWFPLKRVRPALVHFLGHYVDTPLYRREVLRFELAQRLGLPLGLSSMLGGAYFAPFAALDLAKDALRPAYHGIFGARQIRSGVR